MAPLWVGGSAGGVAGGVPPNVEHIMEAGPLGKLQPDSHVVDDLLDAVRPDETWL